MNLHSEFEPADPLSALRAEFRAAGWKTDDAEHFLSGAAVSWGAAAGLNRAARAARAALTSLLPGDAVGRARGIVVDVASAADLAESEINAAADAVRQAADPDAEVLVGWVRDETMAGVVRVTVIALND